MTLLQYNINVIVLSTLHTHMQMKMLHRDYILSKHLIRQPNKTLNTTLKHVLATYKMKINIPAGTISQTSGAAVNSEDAE